MFFFQEKKSSLSSFLFFSLFSIIFIILFFSISKSINNIFLFLIFKLKNNEKIVFPILGGPIIDIILLFFLLFFLFLFCKILFILIIIFFIKLFISQKDLADFILATDDNFINKKDYNIILEKNNFEIKKIYVGNNKYLYKIVYVDNDNISYESVILLYDPELFIDNIKIYKSSKDNNKYIIYVRELYV